MPAITPNLWFDDQGEQAAQFYCSVFPNSRITGITHYGENAPRAAGEVMTVDFELDGQAFSSTDQARADRAMQAVFGMRKIDIAAVRAAADRS